MFFFESWFSWIGLNFVKDELPKNTKRSFDGLMISLRFDETLIIFYDDFGRCGWTDDWGRLMGDCIIVNDVVSMSCPDKIFINCLV